MNNKRFPAAVVALIMLLLSLASCADNSIPSAPEMAYYSNFEDMKTDVTFDLYIPTEVPDGFVQTAAWRYNRDEVYITYTNGTREILFTAVKGGNANIDPENIFNRITEEKMGDFSVKILERFDTPVCVNLTKFKKSSVNYAIDSVTPEEARVMISSMKAISSVSDFIPAVGGTTEKFDSLSALTAAFGIEIPFPDSLNATSYEILSGFVAQIKFAYEGTEYIYAVSNGTSSKDLYKYKTNNNTHDYNAVLDYELYMELFGSRGEAESDTIICTASWAEGETLDDIWYTLFTEDGTHPDIYLELIEEFHKITAPERVIVEDTEPAAEEIPAEEAAE